LIYPFFAKLTMKLLDLIEDGSLKILVVSLKSDVERRNKISSELLKHNLSFSFIDAIDGGSLSAKDFFFQSSSSNSRFLSPSELGCSLSHQVAYYEFLKSNCEYLMVLEDDVEISNYDLFRTELSENLDGLLTLLGGQEGLRRPALLNKVRLGRKGLYLRSFYWHFFQRTCSYIVSRNRAKDLIRLWEKGAFLADDWYYILRNANFRGLLYLPIFTHPMDLSHSKIEEERLLIEKRK